jgi:signal recognition particle receptor subunit beta
MPVFNYAGKEVNVKVVYYGPGLSGKTTNIQYIHDNIKPELKGKLVSLATQTDRTLFFDFLPMELGSLGGYKIRLHLYTVPGQVHYNATRKLVLQGVDGIVFVADSQKTMKDANIESFRNLTSNLESYGKNLQDLPHVIQGNKRDLDDLLTMQEINSHLNSHRAPLFEAVAPEGTGVLETLREILRLVMRKLKDKFPMGEIEEEAPPAETEAAKTSAPPVKTETTAVEPEEPATDEPEKEPEPEISEEDFEEDVEYEEDTHPDEQASDTEVQQPAVSVSAPMDIEIAPDEPFAGSQTEVVTVADVDGVGEVEVRVNIKVTPIEVELEQLAEEGDEPARSEVLEDTHADDELADLPEEPPPFDGAPPDMPDLDKELPPIEEPVELAEDLDDKTAVEGELPDGKSGAVEEDVGSAYDPSFEEIEFSQEVAEEEATAAKEGKKRGLRGLFGRKK